MTLSVVIPTLNATRELPAAIAALRNLPDEVIAADGGSTDGTPEVATGLGARVVRAAGPGNATCGGSRGGTG